MTQGKKYGVLQWILIIAAVIALFGTRIIPPPSGLSQSGLQIMGIMTGALILWVGLGVDWPSLLVLLALMTIPELGSNAVLAGSFGNPGVVFLIFCMMLAACLTKTGLAKRLAICFLTNKLSRKRPWWTIAMFYLAVFVLGSFVSAGAGIVITLPIAVEILERIGCKKKDGLSTMLVLGTVVVGMLANCSTPIAHAMSIQGIYLYHTYTGGELDFFSFCATLLPVALVCLIVFYLICRFLWRPDVSHMTELDFDNLKQSIGPMSKREKISAVVYMTVVILWILPGLFKYIAPGIYPYVSWINQNYPPIVAVITLNFIYADGKKVLSYKDAFGNVAWGAVVFMAAINMLGNATANPEIGLPDWLAGTLTPVFSGISPTVFMIIIVLFIAIVTNFASNAVAIAIGYAIALPLVLTIYDGAINPALMGLFVTCAGQFSYATPPATPSAAIASESGWMKSSSMCKWGMICAVVFAFILIGAGSVTGKMFT